MSKTIQDHITDALEELTERDLKKFKTKLCDRPGEPKIRKGVIETAEPADLAHKIVRTYTECKAAPVTVEVLQAIDENQIAEELRQNTIAYCIYGDVMMIETTGALEETAKQNNLTVNGVSASCKMAEQDLSRLNDYKDIIVRVGKRKQMDPAVISAIISRQSRAGAVLKNGWGDCENAFGLMQVNKLYYTPEAEWNSEEHVAQGTQILIDFIIRIKIKFPNWPKEHWFKGGIAAYCAGDGNVESYEKVDDHTPGKDFANDVVARAQWYKKNGF